MSQLLGLGRLRIVRGRRDTGGITRLVEGRLTVDELVRPTLIAERKAQENVIETSRNAS